MRSPEGEGSWSGFTGLKVRVRCAEGCDEGACFVVVLRHSNSTSVISWQ